MPSDGLELGAYDRVMIIDTKELVWESLGEDEGMPEQRARLFGAAFRKASNDAWDSFSPTSIAMPQNPAPFPFVINAWCPVNLPCSPFFLSGGVEKDGSGLKPPARHGSP